MRIMLTFLFVLGLAPLASAQQPSKPVEFWVRSSSELDTSNTKLVTIGKLPTKMKLGKACAGKAGNFQIWQAMSVDPRGTRDGETVDVIANGIPANAEVLASLRVEGSCTEGGTTWTKYSGVLEVSKPKPDKTPAKPAGSPSPKPTKTPSK